MIGISSASRMVTLGNIWTPDGGDDNGSRRPIFSRVATQTIEARSPFARTSAAGRIPRYP
jgi:hypothetical protein